MAQIGIKAIVRHRASFANWFKLTNKRGGYATVSTPADGIANARHTPVVVYLLQLLDRPTSLPPHALIATTGRYQSPPTTWLGKSINRNSRVNDSDNRPDSLVTRERVAR
jgi:hypothetical protein